MILRRLFEDPATGQVKKEGFYIDIGAHHPKRYSNTYFFYKRGWRGINIDAMPGSMKMFNEQRPRDINIEVAISERNSERTFYIFNEPLLNSFDEELSRSRISEIHHVVEEKRIPTKPLKDILSDSLYKATKVDFLSIDVEGLDVEVLRSNDWEVLRPEYILVECYGMSLDEIFNSEQYRILTSKRYELICKTVNTGFFRNKMTVGKTTRNELSA